MHFAYSQHDAATKEHVFDWFRQSLESGLRSYALLDGCMFNSSDIRSMECQSVSFQAALAGSSLENFGLQGPLLCPLDAADSKGLRALLRKADGVPALSFIATPHGMEVLSKRLIWLAICHTEDEQKLHCRFADTRTLPSLLSCLTPEQNALLGEAVGEWAWIARDGSIQSKTFLPPTGVCSPEPEPFYLDKAQFDFLLISAEPDMVFQMLDEKMPDVLPNTLPHELHTRLVHMLGVARSYGITDLPELFQYAVVALGTSDDFDQHTAIRDTWQRISKEGLLFSELAEQWPEDVWKKLGKPTHAAHGVSNLE